MALKDLHRRLKAFRVSVFLTKDGHGYEKVDGRKPPWVTPCISHGTQVVEEKYFFGGSDEPNPDFAVAQREQIKGSEVWLFGVFDGQIGDRIEKYLQVNFFAKEEIKKSRIESRSKEALKKAYLWIRTKLQQEKQAKKIQRAGCASVLVINGQKIVAANLGGYRIVVCRDGDAEQICERHHPRVKRRWSLKVFSGTLHMRIRTAGSKSSKQSEPVVVEKIDSDTEFVILASNGIWQVMKSQEAVNLIRHIDDPQEAAECLAKEALTRMSKGSISCLIIRFD